MSDDRLKLWLDSLKFILGTFTVGIVTLFINAQMKSREIAVQEQVHLSSFVEMALDEDIGPRLKIAEYFSKVTRSPELKRGWEEYLEFLRGEIERKEAEILELRKKIALLDNEISQDRDAGESVIEKTVELSVARNSLARLLVQTSPNSHDLSPEILSALTGYNQNMLRQMSICGDGMKFTLEFDNTGYHYSTSFAGNISEELRSADAADLETLWIDYVACIKENLPDEFAKEKMNFIQSSDTD